MKQSLLLLFALLLMIGACKPTEDAGSVKKRSASYLLEQMNNNAIDYSWFTARIKVNFEAPEQRFAATMNVRIQKDSAIWVSGSKFTVEGVRILMKPDSIYVMDRLARKYMVTDYAYLQKTYNLPANLQAVQSIITGNSLILGNPKSFRSAIKGSQYSLTNVDEGHRIIYTLNALSYLLDKMHLNEAEQKRDLLVQYADYQPIESKNKQFSHFRNLTLKSPETGTITADFRYSRVTFDTPKNMPFRIPSSYRKME